MPEQCRIPPRLEVRRYVRDMISVPSRLNISQSLIRIPARLLRVLFSSGSPVSSLRMSIWEKPLRWSRHWPGFLVKVYLSRLGLFLLAKVLISVPAISFGVWLRKMLNHTQQRARYGLQQTESDIGHRESEMDPDPRMDMRLETRTESPKTIPPPPPPLQLPNSQPFVPLSVSASLMTGGPYSTILPTPPLPSHSGRVFNRDNEHNGHHVIVHDSTPRLNGGNHSLGDISFDDTAASMLQGFIGDGHEWPPWLTTSVSEISNRMPLFSEISAPATDGGRLGPSESSLRWYRSQLCLESVDVASCLMPNIGFIHICIFIRVVMRGGVGVLIV